MLVTVTLFNTNLDEENPYINLGGQEERISAIKAKFGSGWTLKKSAYNPQHPFRLAINYLDVRGTFNYCVFDFGEGFSQGYQRYRFYYIRDALYINDNVCELIVAEDFWARIPPLGINCLPETFTYKNEEVSKRFYKNINASEVYKCVNTYVGKTTGLIFEGYNDVYSVAFLVVTCLGNLFNQEGYRESGTVYPFGNLVFPVLYNMSKRQVEKDAVFEFESDGGTKICSLADFYKLSQVSAGGFSIVGSFLTVFMPLITYGGRTVDGVKTVELYYYRTDTDQSTDSYQIIPNTDDTDFAIMPRGVLRFMGKIEDGDIYDIPDSAILQRFFDEYAKIGYKKITFSCGVNSVDIDPLSFASFDNNGQPASDTTPFIFKQSFVPPYNVCFGKKAGTLGIKTDYHGEDFLQSFENGYFSKKMYIISNSLTAGTYTDAYTEFLRTNYNSSIMGLSVQQDAARRELAIKQGAQTEIFKIQTVKKTISAGVELLKLNPLTAAGQVADIVSSGAQLITEQSASREILSNNQDKERAILDLKFADIYNAPDSATFYGAIGDCVENALFPRVLFFENVALNEIKFAHKIYGYTMPKRIENIQQLEAHTRFDYIRANDIIIQGTYPESMQVLQEVDRLLIEDAFSKGVRFWWTLDGYKDFTLDNPER